MVWRFAFLPLSVFQHRERSFYALAHRKMRVGRAYIIESLRSFPFLPCLIKLAGHRKDKFFV